MGDNKNKLKNELNMAVKNVMHAKEYVDYAIDTVEKEENKQLLQNTLNNINKTLEVAKTSFYGFKK